jgi:hypothetical protein
MIGWVTLGTDGGETIDVLPGTVDEVPGTQIPFGHGLVTVGAVTVGAVTVGAITVGAIAVGAIAVGNKAVGETVPGTV